MELKRVMRAAPIVIFGAVLLSSAVTNHKPEEIASEPSLDAGASKLVAMASMDYNSELTSLTLADNDSCVVGVGEMQSIYEKYRPEPEPEPIPEPEPEPEPEPVQETKSTQSTSASSIDELWLFEATVQAEGYTMHYDGMRLIACTILNRAERNGTSITDELCSGAYTVVNDGTIWRMGTIYSDTEQACLDEMANRTDSRVLYFRTNHYHGFGTPLFHYGNVYFSGE